MQNAAPYQSGPFSFAKIFRFPLDVVRNWFVISSLIRREIKGRYLNSAIGGLWAVVNPLFMLVVYTTVFAGILKIRWEAKGAEGMPPEMRFAMMLYCGMTPWLAFQEAVTRGSNIVIENANLIKKVAFPSESLPIYVVGYTVVNEVIGIAILVIALPILKFDFPTLIYFYPVVLFLRVLFTLGLTFIVATLNVFVRDVGQMMGLALMLWMFLTPIFYPAEFVTRAAPWIKTVMSFNPWFYIVNMYRDIFVNGKLPDPKVVGLVFAIGLVTFAIGYSMFMTSKMKFADEI